MLTIDQVVSYVKLTFYFIAIKVVAVRKDKKMEGYTVIKIFIKRRKIVINFTLHLQNLKIVKIVENLT